jgi:hypothetical protein
MVNVPNRERSFGLSVGTVLCVIAVLLTWRGRIGRAEILGAAGVVLVVFGYARPSLLKYPSDAWWAMATVLGWINARIILSIAYFIVLTPIGLIWRATGRDVLARRRGSFKGWSSYPERHKDPKHFDRMY